MAFFPLLPLLVVVVLVARAYGEIDGPFVHGWAQAHGLTLTTANRPVVWWYLRNARVLRTWGVLAGIGLPPLTTVAFGLGDDGLAGGWVFIFGGHLAGALYAEVALRRPEPSGMRVASLERRELHQYLPDRLRLAPTAITAVLAALVAASWLAPDLDGARRASAVISLVGAVAVAGAVALAQLWIVRRPQPFTESELVDADDAIRSQSVHSLAGSGSAMVLALLSAECWRVSAAAGGAVGFGLGIGGLVALGLSINACLYYGHRAWRVRRTPFLSTPLRAS